MIPMISNAREKNQRTGILHNSLPATTQQDKHLSNDTVINWLLTRTTTCLHSSTGLSGSGRPCRCLLRSQTHHSQQDSSGHLIGPMQRPLSDNPHKGQISMCPAGFETKSLKASGHWDRPTSNNQCVLRHLFKSGNFLVKSYVTGVIKI